MSLPAPTTAVQQDCNYPLDLPSPALASTPQVAHQIVTSQPTTPSQFLSISSKSTLQTPVDNTNTLNNTNASQTTSAQTDSTISFDTLPVIHISSNNTEPLLSPFEHSDRPASEKINPPDTTDSSETLNPPAHLSFYGQSGTSSAEPVQGALSSNDRPDAMASHANSPRASRDSSADSACSNDERQMRQLGQVLGRVIRPDTHASKRVKDCAGTDPDKTLHWVREVSRQPEGRLPIAKQTATGPLLDFVTCSKHKTWARLKPAVIHEFVSPNFAAQQRMTLSSLLQRQGESLVSYLHEFEQIVREGYPDLPLSHPDLVATFLGSLRDRAVAETVVKNVGLPQTLDEAYAAVKREAQVSQFLPPPCKGHVAVVESSAPLSQPVTVEPLVNAIDKLTLRLAKLEAATKTVPVAAARPGPPTQRAYYRCNQTDHVARD